jgi:regulator of sigma E protease
MSNILSTALNILEFVIAFGVLVFLHEFGHFIAARLSGIEVEEFGFGFPPKIVKLFRWKGTDFTLNWLPFGGFCRLKGENATDMSAGSFAGASPWKRLITLLGGPIMNLLLGFILVIVLFMTIGTYDTKRAMVVGVAPSSPAAIANIQNGDIIESVNGESAVGVDGVSSLVKKSVGQSTEVTLLRGSETVTISLVPRVNPPAGEGSMGVILGYPVIIYDKIWQAAPAAFVFTLDQGVQLIMLPANLINGSITPAEARPSSVVGLYSYFSQVKQEDVTNAQQNPGAKNLYVLSYIAILSIALGYTNLLPIPAIDGGRILFLIPELLFKKRVKPEFENRVHLIGFSLLILLMFVLVINDIINPVTLP